MEYLWIFLGIVVAVALFKQVCLPILKGKFGEALVKLALGKNEDGKRHIINDVTIVVEGKSSQIDHVVITDRGITCVETKNYSGRIYGDVSQQQWTQVLAYGKVKNKFYNPVKQNWTHVKRLSELLGKDYPVYSMVVFAQSNTSYIKADNVVGLWNIRSYLNTIGSAGALSPVQIDELAKKIQEFKESNTITAKEHIQEIRQIKEDVKNNICPRCGGTLVLRHGKYGDFFGCSNYPECRFVKKTP